MAQIEKQQQSNPLQVVELQTTPMPMFNKIVRVKNARSARRLMGKIILEFQKKTINSNDAKTLSYLVSTYLQACSVADIEERIKILENK